MDELTYLDFDLSIEGDGGNYRARVLKSPAGEALSEFSQPFSDQDLTIFFLRIGQPRRGIRSMRDSQEMQAAKDFGGRLFQAVFKDEVYSCFSNSLNQARSQGMGLRLRIRVQARELNDLPWEYLYNAHRKQFLSWSVYTPIVRYLEVAHPPQALGIQKPLKIMAMIASPAGSDYAPLDVEREWEQLKDTLAPLEAQGLVKLVRPEKATLNALQRHLRQEDFHVFHFIGHGKFDQAACEGLLLFETEDGHGRPLNGEYLGSLLADHDPLRLVVLNACEGARTSQLDPFSGVAQTLVQQGIPAVIAMQFEITDQAAISFAREFYSALAEGYPVDAALAVVRKAIFAQENDIEWGTPVCFTRAPDGRIFDVRNTSNQQLASPAAPPAQESNLETRLEDAYLKGLNASYLQDWETAGAYFREAAELRPDYRDIAARLAEAEKHNRLAGRFSTAQEKQAEVSVLNRQALEAMENAEWETAIDRWQRLLSIVPDYPKASELLERAQKERASLRIKMWKTVEELGQLTGFIPDDLAANRRGEITPGQQEKISKFAKDGVKFMSALALISLLVFIGTLVGLFSTDDPAIKVIIIIFGSIYLGFTILSLKSAVSLQSLRTSAKVNKITGPVVLVRIANRIQLRVGKTVVAVMNCKWQKTLACPGIYCVYYIGDGMVGRYLLSLEPMTPSDQ